MQELVFNNNNRCVTSSMIIAEMFGKRHDNVLRDIKDMECSAEFSLLNFEESTYSIRGKAYPIYYVTRDGFSFLAMGYTGGKAAKFKEAFIAAFNKMADELMILRNKGMQPLLQTYQLRMLSEPAKSCPSNRWCIFTQASKIMFLIDKHIGSLSEYDLVDGSIGSHWVKYRTGKVWAKTVSHYWHEYKDKRGKQMSNCYEFTELEHFQVWLDTVYCPIHLHEYLHNKFKKDAIMLAKVEAFRQKLLGNGGKAA